MIEIYEMKRCIAKIIVASIMKVGNLLLKNRNTSDLLLKNRNTNRHVVIFYNSFCHKK